MSTVNRRQCLKDLLGALVQTAGTIVVASAVLPAGTAQAKSANRHDESASDLQQRADQLAEGQASATEGAEEEVAKFVNGGFRNAAFRNAGGGGGGFRNGGFANGGGGGAFRNGGWRN